MAAMQPLATLRSLVRSEASRRHNLVVLALLLDIGVVALSVLFNRHSFFLSDNHAATREIQRILPAFGALMGAAVATVNAMAIMTLVTAYAKRIIVTEGMTFAKMSHLHDIANGHIPFAAALTLFIFAVTVALSKGFLPSAVVASLTPTQAPWTAYRTMPLVEFSSGSGVTPDILCEYSDDDSQNSSGRVFAYGVNCPIDSSYGDIYTAGTSSLQGIFPNVSTRNGVSYPSDLLGISGEISTITNRYVTQITDDTSRAVIATDTVDTCMSRMLVDVNCERSLEPGQFFNWSYIPVPSGVPQGIVKAALCDPTGCSAVRYAPHFAGGTITIFWSMDPNSGNTTLSIFSFATYATDMTAPNITCQVAAQEQMVPIRITGGTSVQHLPSLSCPSRPPASPQFLLNVTRMAEMAMIKMQGPDGKIEPINFVPNGTDKMDALQLAIQRMVATGATEMYATMDANTTEQWSNSIDFSYTTARTRLGASTFHSLGFTLSPILLIALVLFGWWFVGFHPAGNISFNPLSPVCTAVAGMNRNELPRVIAVNSLALQRRLEQLPLVLRYLFVTQDRMGFDTADTSAWPGSVDGLSTLLYSDHDKSPSHKKEYDPWQDHVDFDHSNI